MMIDDQPGRSLLESKKLEQRVHTIHGPCIDSDDGVEDAAVTRVRTHATA